MSAVRDPRFMREGWSYVENGEEKLKPDAPQWAQEEFAQWKALWAEVVENGHIA